MGTAWRRSLLPLFAFLILLIPFLVVYGSLALSEAQDREETRAQTERENHRDLDLVSRSLSASHLFGTLAKRFSTRLADALARRLTSRQPVDVADVASVAAQVASGADLAAFRVFPHELVLVSVPRGIPLARPGARRVWRQGLQMGLSDLPEPTVRYLLGESAVSILETLAVEAVLRQVLEFPLVLVVFRKICWGGCAEFENDRGRQGFFWEEVHLPASFPHRLVLVARAGFQGQRAALRRRIRVFLWNTGDRSEAGLAFLPGPRGGRPIRSSAWRMEPALIALEREGLPGAGSSRILDGSRGYAPGAPAGEGSFLVTARPLDLPDHPTLAIARRLPPVRGPLRQATQLVLGFAYLALVFWGTARLFIFGDPEQVPLWVLFVLAFLLAALIPLSGVYPLAAQFFRQEFRQEKKTAQETLRRNFSVVDHGIIEFSSDIVYMLSRAQQNPAFIDRIREEEARHRSTASAAPLVQGTETYERLARLLSEFSESVQDPSSSMHLLPGGRYLPFTRVLGLFIFGTDHLTVFYNDSHLPTPAQLLDLFGLLGKKVLEIRNPALKPPPGLKDPLIDKEAMTIEYISQVFINLGGFESFLSFIYKSDTMVPMKFGHHRSAMQVVELKVADAVRYLTMNTWLEEHQDFPYLRQVLPAIGRKEGAPGPSSQAPAGEGPRIFAVDQTNRLFLETGGEIPPSVREAAFQTMETQLPVSTLDREAGLLVEATPCRNLNRNILAGYLPMGPLLDRLHASQTRFWVAMALGFGLALIVALGAAGIFLIPLRQITRAVREVRDGRFDTTLTLSGRNEFGSLAEAFNSMTRSLQEGQLLGRFVSEPVRLAARAGNLELLAGETHQIDCTVVFSTMGGFEEARRTTPVAALAALLEEHLAIVSEAAARSGGEVDKLFGEKIMVVFDRQRFPSSPAMAGAALAFAREVREGFRKSPVLQAFPMKMGLNSGPALLGFVGSPLVRLDHTVIGDTVNLAARLASLAQTFPGERVLVSGQTLTMAGREIAVRPLAVRHVRGKTSEVEVFELLER